MKVMKWCHTMMHLCIDCSDLHCLLAYALERRRCTVTFGMTTYPRRGGSITLSFKLSLYPAAIKFQFLLQGRKIVLTTRHEVLQNDELLRQFIGYFCYNTADATTIKGVYFNIVKRVINTMANSFLSSQDMLERVANNKGVDAQMTLPDKLKAYAIDTQSIIQL